MLCSNEWICEKKSSIFGSSFVKYQRLLRVTYIVPEPGKKRSHFHIKIITRVCTNDDPNVNRIIYEHHKTMQTNCAFKIVFLFAWKTYIYVQMYVKKCPRQNKNATTKEKIKFVFFFSKIFYVCLCTSPHNLFIM